VSSELGIHGNDEFGMEPQGVVGVVAAGERSLGTEAPGTEAASVVNGIPHVHQLLHEDSMPDCQNGTTLDFPAVELEPLAERVPTAGGYFELLI
jgi:hypothetical protein